ncbi:MAG TPA: NAD-dependent succinate-semialdehyde dehydrogenase [Paraburkholderia sp.]|nr:NAD-dependent succinate-semialdehyde dehydrogenase [Paraburkholderia sp.]
MQAILGDGTLFRQQGLIGNTWLDADAGATLEVDDPSSGVVIGSIPDMGAAEAARAVSAAQAALPGWRALTATARSQILKRWAALILANTNDLATIMTREQGKPLAEARGEIGYAASFVQWFAEEAMRICGDVIASASKDTRSLVVKEPVGVCAAITPWNFPAAMIARKAGPALAAGCTLIVKPANETPFTALALAELALRAGLPAGVLNVVTGDPAAIGEELTRSPVVRKLSFTGSTRVGRLLMRQCADTVKKVSLELGGNAPCIVFDDADLDAAVDGAIAAKYRNAGQTCISVNRLYIHAKVYDEFALRFVRKTRELQVGYGADAGTSIGPLINRRALEKVSALVDDALARGARIATGGRPHSLGGNFYEPTVLTEVVPGMLVLDEEIFGPVAPLVRFTSDEEVIRMANDTIYGLAAYFYSRDIARVWRVAEQLEYGMVGINTTQLSSEIAPFGGVKQSGIGREGSKYGIDDYLEMKYLVMGGL